MTQTPSTISQLSERIKKFADDFGGFLVEGFHLLALFSIGGTIVWAACLAFATMITKGHVSVEDVLLLFIYLELGAMVGIYFKTNRMPVRFLIYVAITALTRLLIGLVNVEHHKPGYDLLIVTGAIFSLTICVLILRYGSYRFPTDRKYIDSLDQDVEEG